MTDTTTQTADTTTATLAPSFDAVAGEGFTAAEQAYFDSRGENTDGLAPTDTNGAASVASPQTEGVAALAATQEAAPTDKANGEEDDGSIEISADGKLARDTKTGRFVPIQALHRERERLQASKAELSELREKFTRADERLAVFNKAFEGQMPATAGQKADETAPDPEKDIFGAFKWATDRIAKLETKLDSTAKNTQVELARTALRQHYDASVGQYKKAQPNFDAAKQFLTEGRHKELEAIGYADQKERQDMIDQQEAQLAVSAYRNKQSAPELLYKLAVARGFNPTPPKVEEVKPSEAALKLDQIARGQAAAASLVSAGGGPSSQLTAEAVANMTEEQFDAAVKKVGSQAALMRLVGLL